MFVKCDPCALIYSTAFLFKKHMINYHKDVNSCESCEESFQFKHLLFRHVLSSKLKSYELNLEKVKYQDLFSATHKREKVGGKQPLQD